MQRIVYKLRPIDLSPLALELSSPEFMPVKEPCLSLMFVVSHILLTSLMRSSHFLQDKKVMVT